MLRKCEMCNGKGHLMLPGLNIGVSCDVCRGKGGFDVPDNKELCPTCGGSRTTTFSIGGLKFAETCKTCYGTGFVDKDDKISGDNPAEDKADSNNPDE